MSGRIVVLVRQVPDPNGFRIGPDGAPLLSGPLVLNPFDEFAIEAAIQLKESDGYDVVVITAGPGSAREALVRALAMGADRAIHIWTGEDVPRIDSLALAARLAEEIRPLSPNLVLTGHQSSEAGTGAVGIQVAELLDLPHVSSVTSVRIEDGVVFAERDTEQGRQPVDASLPVVILAMTGLNEPRNPTLKGLMQAKKKPIDVVQFGDCESASQLSWSEPYVAERSGAGVIVRDTSPEEAAAQLVRWMRDQNLTG